MVDGVVAPEQMEHEPCQRLLALHKYVLNADFLRDVLMRRIHGKQLPAAVDSVTAMDNMIAMSLWYAAVYVVIEG